MLSTRSSKASEMRAIMVRDLVKVYRSKKRVVQALRGVTFDVGRGEFFALLGPNGAGKTTTTKILATLLLPDGGRAEILGHDVVEEADEVRRLIGWMEGETGGRSLYWRLSGRDNLRLFASLYGIHPRDAEVRIRALLRFFDLEDAADRLVKDYSLGMRIKLCLARALIHDPEVLLLDEPTLGLDVQSAQKVRELLMILAREEGKTIFFTSHNMFEVERLADRVAVINRGRIVFVGTPEELRRRMERVKVVRVTLVSQEPSEVLARIASLSVVRELAGVTRRGDITVVRVIVDDPYEAISELARALRGMRVERIERELPSLEEAFLRLVFGGPPGPEFAPHARREPPPGWEPCPS